jgi:hypothetical protein
VLAFHVAGEADFLEDFAAGTVLSFVTLMSFRSLLMKL